MSQVIKRRPVNGTIIKIRNILIGKPIFHINFYQAIPWLLIKLAYNDRQTGDVPPNYRSFTNIRVPAAFRQSASYAQLCA